MTSRSATPENKAKISLLKSLVDEYRAAAREGCRRLNKENDEVQVAVLRGQLNMLNMLEKNAEKQIEAMLGVCIECGKTRKRLGQKKYCSQACSQARQRREWAKRQAAQQGE